MATSLPPAGCAPSSVLDALRFVVTMRVGEPFFSAHGADVWLVDLSPTARLEDVVLLSPEERERMGRFIDEKAAARYASAHAAARRVLARRLGGAPAEVVLGRRPCPGCGDPEHGPPTVLRPEQSVNFSLSRAGRYGLVGVATTRWVGVDIEEIRYFSTNDVIARCLSGDEQAYVAGLGAEDGLAAFYRCWVRKEAVLKAVGVGITADLTSVPVHPERAGPLEVSTSEIGAQFAAEAWPGRLLVEDLPPLPGYAGALAVSA